LFISAPGVYFTALSVTRLHSNKWWNYCLKVIMTNLRYYPGHDSNHTSLQCKSRGCHYNSHLTGNEWLASHFISSEWTLMPAGHTRLNGLDPQIECQFQCCPVHRLTILKSSIFWDIWRDLYSWTQCNAVNWISTNYTALQLGKYNFIKSCETPKS
jgi:hypothetical protein